MPGLLRLIIVILSDLLRSLIGTNSEISVRDMIISISIVSVA